MARELQTVEQVKLDLIVNMGKACRDLDDKILFEFKLRVFRFMYNLTVYVGGLMAMFAWQRTVKICEILSCTKDDAVLFHGSI